MHFESKIFLCSYIILIYVNTNPSFFLRKRSSHLRSIVYEVFFERILFYGKIHHFLKVFVNNFPAILGLLKDPFLHYVRYHGKSILATNDTPLLMNKWKFYFVNLWQCYFSVSFPSQKVNINQLSKDNLEFIRLCQVCD